MGAVPGGRGGGDMPADLPTPKNEVKIGEIFLPALRAEYNPLNFHSALCTEKGT